MDSVAMMEMQIRNQCPFKKKIPLIFEKTICFHSVCFWSLEDNVFHHLDMYTCLKKYHVSVTDEELVSKWQEGVHKNDFLPTHFMELGWAPANINCAHVTPHVENRHTFPEQSF